jgi:phage terminase large subunit-like protein
LAKRETRGDKVIRFIETYCLTPEGDGVGRPIKLAPFQKKFIRDVYDNKTVTRRGYLSIARKNGKTALIAGILLAHLIGPEAKLNSQIISGARSREQAAQVYNYASKMIMLSAQLSQLVKITPSSKKLTGIAKNVEYRALSADGTTAHGLSPILAILDEVGQVRGPQDDFIDAITTAQGAHSNPLLLAISTQAPTDADLFSIWLDDAKNANDKTIVSHVYAADENAGLLNKRAWKAANPALGIFRSLKDMEFQALQAERMPSAENTFRNLCLNQRVNIFSPFVSKTAWLANGGAIDQEAFYENPVFCGLDLSARNDLTALVLVCKDYEGIWHVKSHFFTPLTGLRDRSQRDRAPYDVWHSQGFITATPGSSVDYSIVAETLCEICDDFDVSLIAFDRWRIDVLQKELQYRGRDLPLLPFGQGYKDMSPALDVLEAELLQTRVRHGNNPVLTMCAANSVAIKDPAGNRKLDKSKATGRIDGLVALAMAMGAAHGAQEQMMTIGQDYEFLAC